jgi:HPt (histidine-containing phosphotransfer) domain-containing protein
VNRTDHAEQREAALLNLQDQRDYARHAERLIKADLAKRRRRLQKTVTPKKGQTEGDVAVAHHKLTQEVLFAENALDWAHATVTDLTESIERAAS